MTTSPYAKVLMAVDGGSAIAGAQTLAGGNLIQLSGENTSGWTQQLWEIYEYPTGFTVPAGWTSVNGVYQYSGVTPPSFTISAAATRWGKYMFRLTVNGGLLNGVYSGEGATQPLVDSQTCVSVRSPNLGLYDIAFGESNQFDTVRQWIGDVKRTLRLLDTIAGGGSPSGNDGEVQTKSGATFVGATGVKAGSGYVSIGASPAATGFFRVPYSASLTSIMRGLAAVGTEADIISQQTATIIFGNPTNWSTAIRGASLELWGQTGGVYAGAGGSSVASWTSTAWTWAVPVKCAGATGTGGDINLGNGGAGIEALTSVGGTYMKVLRSYGNDLYIGGDVAGASRVPGDTTIWATGYVNIGTDSAFTTAKQPTGVRIYAASGGSIAIGFGTTTQLYLGVNGPAVYQNQNFLVHGGGAGSPGVGGGVGVIGVGDALTVPSSNPSGGIVAYSEGGVWKIRTPTGIFPQAGPSQAMAALSVDWSKGTVFTKTLAAGGNTITFANALDGQTISVILTGAASTVTWPTVKWSGGTAPTQTSSGTDVYTFIKAGSTIYGSVVQNMS